MNLLRFWSRAPGHVDAARLLLDKGADVTREISEEVPGAAWMH